MKNRTRQKPQSNKKVKEKYENKNFTYIKKIT